MLPIIAGPKEVLDIPCSSAKYERMYSVGGRNVTKIRKRIKPSKVEHLVVSAKSRTKVLEFLGSSLYKLTVEDNTF